jgi:hypothetical protein
MQVVVEVVFTGYQIRLQELEAKAEEAPALQERTHFKRLK